MPRFFPQVCDAGCCDDSDSLVHDARRRVCTSSNCAKYELFRTDDGGLRWSSLGNPKDSAANCAFGHLVGPLFASVGRGWLALNLGAGGAAGGSGGLLTTDDGGKRWRCAITPPNTNLVSAADPLHVWVTSQERALRSHHSLCERRWREILARV